MILSDRSLREQLDAGRIIIDPLDDSLIQPSSIDVRISNLFRVENNGNIERLVTAFPGPAAVQFNATA